jgi:hypothetical protein
MMSFYQVGKELLDSVRNELQTIGAAIPGRACVVPGAIAWEDCECDGGQLAITVLRTYLSDNFPSEQETIPSGKCGSAYIVAELLILLIRCAPQPPEGSLTVSCTALDASAKVVDADAAAVRRAAPCRLQELLDDNDIDDYIVRQQDFVGPQGACVGSELHVLVSVRNV